MAATMALTMLMLISLLFIASVTAVPHVPRDTKLDSSSGIVSVNGTKHFSDIVARNEFTFVKFFHPRCPHCVALAPHFKEFAKKLAERSKELGLRGENRVYIAEVDASRKENSDVVNANADGYPTLKLFKKGRLIAEYEGVRRADPMLHFVASEVMFVSAPLVEFLNTTNEVNAYLKRVSTRPVVLSVFHSQSDVKSLFPPHARPCPLQWNSAISRMRNGTAPQVMFAVVRDPSLLSPPLESALVRFEQSKKVTFPPALAAAPSGQDFWRKALWWYPGIREQDSMETFMHVNTLPSGAFITLDERSRDLAHDVFSTTRALLLLFDKDRIRPRWKDQAILQEASRIPIWPRLLPVYLDISNNIEISEFVGIDHESVLNGSQIEPIYIFYRNTATQPIISRYNASSDKKLSVWVADHAESVNRSNIAIPAGVVFHMDTHKWDHLFQYDGRAVLLVVHSGCWSCYGLSRTLDRVAQMLVPHAGAIVVASFDSNKYTLPASPALPIGDSSLPAFFYIAPGAKAVAYKGMTTHRAIATFARRLAEMDDVAFGSLETKDSLPLRIFQLGFLLVCIGALTSPRRPKRIHVT